MRNLFIAAVLTMLPLTASAQDLENTELEQRLSMLELGASKALSHYDIETDVMSWNARTMALLALPPLSFSAPCAGSDDGKGWTRKPEDGADRLRSLDVGRPAEANLDIRAMTRLPRSRSSAATRPG
jgi:hypothetical protein